MRHRVFGKQSCCSQIRAPSSSFPYGSHVVEAETELIEPHHFTVDGSVFVVLDLGNSYFVVEGGQGSLLVAQDLLVEFLAGPESGVFDFDIFSAAQSNHLLGQVGNLHWTSHIEDENLAALTLGASLKNKLAGLGNEHEIAYDVGMGHRDRASKANLLLEEGNDGAIGVEHIAEPCRNELGDTLHLPIFDGIVKALHVNLADALGATHHIGGIDSLVGGNHDELTAAVFQSQVSDNLGADDIVVDTLAGVVLQHGHVLVGSCMEDIFGTIGLEDVIHTVFLTDAHEDGLSHDVGKLVAHHQPHVMERRLGLVDENEHLGAELGHLLHNLATNTAGSAGDEDVLAAELLLDIGQIDVDGGAR